MRIIQSTIRYSPALGGVEEYVKQISERLAKRKHQVSVFASDLEEIHSFKRIKNKPDEINGVKIKRGYTIPFRLRDYVIMPSLPLMMAQEETDIIHGHCFMQFPMDVALVLSRIKRVPFVFNPYFTVLGESSFLGTMYKKTLGRLALQADVVITISDFESRLIKKSGFPVKRLEMIYPGVDFGEFERVNYNVYKRYGLEKQNIVLFVGRLDKNKGVDTLVEAAPFILRDVPETAFFIIGPDFGEAAKLQQLAKENKVSEKIKFAGSLDRPDLISAFKNAKVFVLPSRYEAFGIALIEAMAAKLPVVASDCSAIPYVVNNGRTGLLFPLNDKKRLAECILQLLADQNLREKIGLEGYSDVKEKYNWDKNVDKLEDIYNSLLKS